MQRAIHRVVTVLVLLLSGTLVHAQKPLVLGIFPYASPEKLIKHQKGLKDHLEQGLGRPISIVTAKNFKVFIKNTKAGNYDLVYAAPHLARLLDQEYAYQRIAMTTHHIQGLFIVLKTAPYKQLSDLRNRRIALVPPLAILAQIARKELRDVGLKANEGYTVIKMKNFNNAIFSVVKDDSDASVTGIKIWKTLAKQYRDKLRVLVPTRPIQGFMMMASPELSRETVQKLRQSSLSFNDTAAGKKYLFKGLKLIDKESMQGLDEFTTVLK